MLKLSLGGKNLIALKNYNKVPKTMSSQFQKNHKKQAPMSRANDWQTIRSAKTAENRMIRCIV